ncbi:MAG: cobalamin-binding protein [Nitrososphaeraceae archaeon]|nr:cobalamin-binding protein [Nitrososphaeraceae archaeon]
MGKKIVSFLPSATEILYNLDVGSQVAGVTHECTYPEEAKLKPKVITSCFDPSQLTSKEIDKKIFDLVRNETSLFILNEILLKDLKPDLIVAQGICEVCSPFKKEIFHAISILGYHPEILILDPHNLKDILNNIMEIAEKVDKIQKGKSLVEFLNNKINIITNKRKNKDIQISSRILCLEWIDPFFTAGHWIPEMVEIAGGINGLSRKGDRSKITSLEEIKNFDPDKIILMPCGFDIDRTTNEYEKILENNSSWNSLRAIKEKEVYVVDAGSYFSKPGPRTFVGVEVLAKIINPNEFNYIRVPSKSFMKLD